MTEQAAPQRLADGFAPADHDTWRALVDKALKGGDFEKRLVSRTADGLGIKPLYVRADAVPGAQAAVPGAAPFARGTRAQAEGHGWQIMQRVVVPDVAEANAVVLEELEGGASGVVLQIAGPGQDGIKITSDADMARVLEGVYLDYASVALAAGLNAPAAARQLLAAIAKAKSKAGEAVSHLHVDPIGALARFGTAGTAIDAALADAVKLAGEVKTSGTRLTTVLVDATIPHEAGASDAQELAFLAAALVAYLRAFDKAGTSVQDAMPAIAYSLAVDTDLFLTAAKLRAARTIIARIAVASGADAKAMHITAVTSARMMAKRDPWTNMLRTTAACAGAAFGGADAVTVLPFTQALGAPDRFARRIARNTQLVLQEESSLGRVVDPAGGSWYVEKLTDDLARAAWEKFQAIEATGGLVAALGAGTLQGQIAQVAKARAKAIATGRQELTGISVFPKLGDDGVKTTPNPPPSPAPADTVIEPLVPHRLGEAFEELRDASDKILAASGARPRVFLANLGAVVEHNRRSTWAWNLLAAGGIEGLTSDGYNDAGEAAAAFKKSEATIACICSSDEVYAREAEAAARALKASGAKRVLLAGKPGDAEAALRAAGVDQFLYAGQDAVSALRELQAALA